MYFRKNNEFRSSYFAVHLRLPVHARAVVKRILTDVLFEISYRVEFIISPRFIAGYLFNQVPIISITI